MCVDFRAKCENHDSVLWFFNVKSERTLRYRNFPNSRDTPFMWSLRRKNSLRDQINVLPKEQLCVRSNAVFCIASKLRRLFRQNRASSLVIA